MAVRKNIPFDEILGELRKFYESVELFMRLNHFEFGPFNAPYTVPKEMNLSLTGKKMEASSQELERLYKFAVLGEGPEGDILEIKRDLDYAEDFLGLLGSDFGKANYKGLSHLIELYYARVALDGDGENGAICEPDDYLSVRQVALLGCLDERSVRNAISQGDMKASKDGSATVIPNEEAQRWLLGRRGFKRTIWPCLDMDGLDQVKSVSQFRDYLYKRKKEIASLQPIDEILRGYPSLSLDDVLTLEKGEFPWPISTCSAFSGFYQVPERTMIAAVMKLFFPEQYLLIEEQLQNLNRRNINMNIIDSSTSFELLPEGKSQMASNPEKVGSQIASAIAKEVDTPSKLAAKFYGGNLAPRSKQYRRSLGDCEDYIKGYLSWMIDNRWISIIDADWAKSVIHAPEITADEAQSKLGKSVKNEIEKAN